MMLYILILLFFQSTQESLGAISWKFRQGTEFYIEETQRHLLVLPGSQLKAYMDYTQLWRYYPEKVQGDEVILLATLERIRINNPNEMGARAGELLKQHENTKSRWKLTKQDALWSLEPLENQPQHAPPHLLSMGTSRWAMDSSPWVAEWPAPANSPVPCKLVLTHTLKEQTADRIQVRTRAEFQNTASEAGDYKQVTLKSQPAPLQGLGDYDRNRERWLYYEIWASVLWKLENGSQRLEARQDLYCNYRFHEKRPVFP
ncbi:MAG TPA: hypothetical protein PKD72_09100 [Gemmatales bacterium]|nr:hypothetical protein [Gemmatales bacterium]